MAVVVVVVVDEVLDVPVGKTIVDEFTSEQFEFLPLEIGRELGHLASSVWGFKSISASLSFCRGVVVVVEEVLEVVVGVVVVVVVEEVVEVVVGVVLEVVVEDVPDAGVAPGQYNPREESDHTELIDAQ